MCKIDTIQRLRCIRACTSLHGMYVFNYYCFVHIFMIWQVDPCLLFMVIHNVIIKITYCQLVRAIIYIVDVNMIFIEVIVIFLCQNSFNKRFTFISVANILEPSFYTVYICMYVTRLRVDLVILWRNSWFQALTIKRFCPTKRC